MHKRLIKSFLKFAAQNLNVNEYSREYKDATMFDLYVSTNEECLNILAEFDFVKPDPHNIGQYIFTDKALHLLNH